MPHLRETIVASIKSKLEDIIPTGGGYNYSGKLKSVQRYKHRFDGTRPQVNLTADTPTILLRVISELSSGEREYDSRSRMLEVDLEWVSRGGETSDSQLPQAIEDVERALFVNPSDLENSFGVSAGPNDFSVSLLDPLTSMQTDGFHFVVTIPYTTGLDPTTLGG